VVKVVEAPDLVAVRTQDQRPALRGALGARSRLELLGLARVAHFRRAGVEVFRIPPRAARARRDHVRRVLKQDPAVRFVGRVLVDPRSGTPALYTENLFLKLRPGTSSRVAARLAARHGLVARRALRYADSAFELRAPEGTGWRVFAIAERLRREEGVTVCYPEIVRPPRPRGVFPGQWHLARMRFGSTVVDQHVDAERAWHLSRGEGVTIAVIDDGVDIDHPEFAATGKVVAPWDVGYRSEDPRPLDGDNHGTACAGVACADGRDGASGVAPGARLMPIRWSLDLGSIEEADAIDWAVTHGADVISCSWGPADGDPDDPSDPRHFEAIDMPEHTHLAIQTAIDAGRDGRGCVFVWAAGNGAESVDLDGYAADPRVMAVAATNDAGTRAYYSDTGDALWCAFPSNHRGTVTPGIWTTDRSGAVGYNAGDARHGDLAGDYTSRFGGTSSACPGVAGVVALVLARRPDLTWQQVRDVLRASCDRIDAANGKYDANGHSPLYGYGRVNAFRAVKYAIDV
jgi:subtilisin family serine protease